MPTMKDIAKRAGVSYGTVSNVLNDRGNVSLEKIKLVRDAANELGYYLNATAKSLRSSTNNMYTFVVPSLNNYKYRKLYNLLRRKYSAQNIQLQLQITDYNSFIEKQVVINSASTSDIIIIISCMKNAEHFYNSKILSKNKLIFIDSDIKIIDKDYNKSSISFDTQQLSENLVSLIESKSFKKILLFSDNYLYERLPVLQEYNITYEYSDLTNDSIAAIPLLKNNDFDLIVCTSPEKYEAIIQASHILQQQSSSEYFTIVSNKMIFDKNRIYYYQDINFYVEAITNLVSETNTQVHTTLPFYGLLNQFEEVKLSEEINFLMIESPTSKAIKTINPLIEEMTGLKINIDVFKYNEYDVILDDKSLARYDLVRIDMAYLPDLAERVFKPIKEIYDELKDRLVIHNEEYIKHNNTYYTIPLDIGSQILMYRDDILNDQSIRREIIEKTKMHQIVPTSFEEYNIIEKFFHDYYGESIYGSTVCNGSDMTRAGEFLARVRSANILTEKNDLNIQDPEILQALSSYLTSIRFSSNRNNTFWDQTIHEYAEGKTAMAITFSNYIHMLSELNKDIAHKTKFALPPYHKSLIGGGVIGLTKHTEKITSIKKYINLLYSDRIGKLITYLGGTMPIKSIYSDGSLTSIYPWINYIPQAIDKNTRKYLDKEGNAISTIQYEKKIGEELRKYLAYNLNIR